MASSAGISPNARRWLNTLAFAEGTWDTKAQQPRYAITFGYTPIGDLSKHPDRVVKSGGYSSAAAGAYQFMPGTWEGVRRKLNLPDFGPVSQDLGALELIRQRGVDPDKDPITPVTLAKLAPEWASLPTLSGGSYYGQPSKSATSLMKFSGQVPTSDSYTAASETTRGAEGTPPAGYSQEELEQYATNQALVNAVGQALLGTIIRDFRSGGDAASLDLAPPKTNVPLSSEADVELSEPQGLTREELEEILANKQESAAIEAAATRGKTQLDSSDPFRGRAAQNMQQALADAQKAFQLLGSVF